MIDTDTFLKRIDELLTVNDLSELYIGTLSLASSLFGQQSSELEAIKSMKPLRPEEAQGPRLLHDSFNHSRKNLQGTLRSFRKQIESGLIRSIQAQAKVEVLTDFVVLAKEAMEDKGKDVAAVLACAALEDSLKRFAEMNNIDVKEKTMFDVISALKTSGFVNATQGTLLQSFTKIRNKAFHANWDKIESAEVQSIIGFVEQFILTKF